MAIASVELPRGIMSGKLVVITESTNLEGVLTLPASGSGSARFDIQCVAFEPPCDASQLQSAEVVVVDGTKDLPFALAECGRLRPLVQPLALIACDPVAIQGATLRAGIGAVLQRPASLLALEHCAGAFSPCSQPGVIERVTRLNRTVWVDRDRRILLVDGREEILSAQKFNLLCYLIDRAGSAVTSAELVRVGLLRHTQMPRYKGLIQELKAKLGSARNLIRAVPGYGYRVAEAEPDRSTL